MASQMKDFQIYITDFRKWEEELRRSKTSAGSVLVCDIHASWCGPCKAIQPTFQRLFLEYSEEKDVRFLVVDAEKIITGMKSEGEEEAYGEEGDIDDDTRRENWLKVLQPLSGKSQPTFVLYQSGRMKRQVLGVNTPLITKLVKQLTSNEEPSNETSTPPSRPNSAKPSSKSSAESNLPPQQETLVSVPAKHTETEPPIQKEIKEDKPLVDSALSAQANADKDADPIQLKSSKEENDGHTATPESEIVIQQENKTLQPEEPKAESSHHPSDTSPTTKQQ